MAVGTFELFWLWLLLVNCFAELLWFNMPQALMLFVSVVIFLG
jgi:hypothetical protein